jgi:serine/threonine protein kinase
MNHAKKHINDPVPPPRQVNPAVPPAVERIILKALAKNPADRYQRSADMASELADALKAFEEPWPPEHIIVKVEGRVSAILDKGFSLDTGQGMTEIVSTLSRGDRLGLHPGDYAIVFGEYDLNHVLRSYANIRKVFPNGQVVIIKDEPYKRKRPWWEFW